MGDPNPRKISGKALRGWLILAPLLLWLWLLTEQSRHGAQTWLSSWAIELGVAVAILACAWALGSRLLRAIWPAAVEGAGAVYPAIGLGLGLIAATVFGLGTVGWIGRIPIVVGLLIGTILAAIDLIARIRRWIELGSAVPETGRWLDGVIVTLPLLWGFPWASMPPVFYDAMVYHLGLPSLYLASGSLEYPASFSLAGYPQNAELIFLVGIAAGNEIAARITGFLLCALTALALRGLVRERIGRAAANLSYLLLVSQWFFWFQAVFTKVDLIGAFFLVAMFHVVFRARANDGIRPWIVCGLLAGLAVGVKFANLLPLGIVLVTMPWFMKGAKISWVRRAALIAAIALLVASPWMIRNIAHRGNPLFPAFYDVLGGSGWQAHNADRMRAETGMNIDRSAVAAVQRVASIGWRPGYGSGGELPRVWLPLLALGLFFTRDRYLRWVLVCAALSLAVGVMFFTGYLRVHAFAVATTAIAAGGLWVRLHPRPVRWLFGMAAAVLIGYGFLVSAQLCDVVSGRGSRVIAGRLNPWRYADEQLGYLRVAWFVNENLDENARIRLIGSARSAYIERPAVGSYVWDDPWLSMLSDDPASNDHLLDELREDGFTHLLFDSNEMQRLERAAGLFGYSKTKGGRARIDRFVRSLPVVTEANGVFLYAIADGPPRQSRSAW